MYNFILRKLQWDSQTLNVEYVQTILDTQKDDDRVYRAIINSSLSNKKLNNIQTGLNIESQSDFGEKILNQLNLSMQSLIQDKQTEIQDNIQENEYEQFNNDVSIEEFLKQQLQSFYRLYKATIRTNGDGLQTINNYILKQEILLQKIKQIYCQESIKQSQQFVLGCDMIDKWHLQSIQLYSKVNQLKQIISLAQKDHLQQKIKIVEKYKSIQRIKYTLEKIKILKQTFGKLSQQLEKNDDNAYEIIPIMKETQNNIDKYKLNELKLSCINEHFFENKIENLKERIKQGIFQTFLMFDENKYFTLLKSYYLIEKHYQMPSFITQVWGLIKKSISISFKKGIQQFEQQYKPQKIYQNVQDEDLLEFYQKLYGEIVDQMLNFHYCNRFHQDHEFCLQDENTIGFEEYAEQIRQTYLEIRQLIWQQIQKKIVKIITTHLVNIKALQKEHLFLFLGYNCLLIKRAEDFSHSESHNITKCIMDTYMSYITQFHKTNIIQISQFVTNEQFSRLPLAREQKLSQQLQQLTQLNQINIKLFEYLIIIREENYSPEQKKTINIEELINNDEEMQLFYLFEYQNPFKLQQDEFELIIKAIKLKNYSQNKNNIQSTLNNESVLTQSSLKILELLPQYVILAFYHPVCQQHIIQLYIQLLELYMFVSYTQLVNSQTQKQLLENFNQVIKYDENKEIDFYISSYDSYSECLVIQEKYCIFKRFIQKFCSEGVNLKELDLFSNKDRKQLVDIGERAIASESLQYLFNQTKSTFLQVGINSQYFDVFYENYCQYKELIYRNFMQTFIKIDGIIQYIPQLKWEIKELHNENNQIYLDRLIQFILDQKEKLKSIGGGIIPTNAQNNIFQFLAEHCLNVLLETFGKIKKLNNVGREQMKYEFTTCYNAIEMNQKNQNQTTLNQKIIQQNLEFLTIFNSNNFEDIDIFISKNKTQIPLRLLYNLLITNQSYLKLSKQMKKDVITKFFKEYYDTFKLF